MSKKIYYGGSFNPNDAYFFFNGSANIQSCNYPGEEDSPFYMDDLVDRIIRTENAFGYDEIADVLNGDEDEDEETEV